MIHNEACIVVDLCSRFFGADRHYLKQSLGAHSVGVGVLVLSVDVEQL